ncbi:MAG: chemotaxis protein CheB [Xanthobacteraceae bacterium]|nr:chemotaxis protein CheB [Xanthobacteraceae bacterium]MBV9236978.1 chemotaxis protein CheB [Xanthobacteraceae bacterium]MBV9627306.1 chemotaxis protein CheB [Xanthobacteraceae bacterium]
MANRNIVAIGASAGGVEALRLLASKLPRDLQACVLIVIHLPTQFRSELDMILSEVGPLPATFAREGETLKNGHIFIAPAGFHLLVQDDQLRLGIGQRENNARPAIDPLFRSVALCCGPRAIGVVLTGTLGDGASGLLALKQCGAITVVQEPRDARFAEMPATAMARSNPQHVVTLAALPGLLAELVHEPAGAPTAVPNTIKYEVEVAKSGQASMSNLDRIGRRSVLACPDCHGVMWEIDEGDLVRYRCHVGHAYTAELMSLALDENLTRALGSALRALDERIALAGRMSRQADESNRPHLAQSWSQKAQEFQREADVIRAAISRVDELAGELAQEPDTPPQPDRQRKRAAEAPSDRRRA